MATRPEAKARFWREKGNPPCTLWGTGEGCREAAGQFQCAACVQTVRLIETARRSYGKPFAASAWAT